MSEAGPSERPAHLSVAKHEDISRLDPALFPLIEDFGIRLKDCGPLGMHVMFFSKDEALDLASFPWWDNAQDDLRIWSSEKIPLGTPERPYDDLEQGWHIVIWESEGLVFIAEGDDPMTTNFPACFCVERDTYLRAWQDVIEQAKSPATTR